MGRETNRRRRERQAVSAREKAAAARAEHRRAEQRRRATVILASVVAIAVLAAVGAFIAINAHSKQSNQRLTASSNVVDSVTSVTPATLDRVGGGSAQQIAQPTSGEAALTSHGKPQVLFIGGEFCPYCAAERWPLVQALSRFGTFSNLSQIHSADEDGDIATFTFYKSSYTSKYLVFHPVEAEDRNQKSLEKPSKAETALWVKHTGNPPGFPFLDFGGKYFQTNAGYQFTDLSGLSWQQIANDLKDPTGKVAQDILGEANNLTATICKMTNNQPASVCLTPTITNLQSEIGAGA